MSADPAPADRRGSGGAILPHLRAARETDVSAIAEIYNEAVRTTVATFDTEPRSPEAQQEWLRHHGPLHPVLVAEHHGEVVGWASLSAWSDRPAYDGTAEVSFYVRSEYRGRGIGRALLTSLIAAADGLGLHALLARIADGNAVSVHLHEALGFRRVGVMKEVGFKFDRWIDVHLLERTVP
ncbi:MAG: N-acetyltransferase family protein [Thermoplasmata archaeon]|nr:N-acetyltransferase family protein [Thermoplasmata archaeon]